MCPQVRISMVERARQSADSHEAHKVSGSKMEPQACCLQSVTTSHTVVEQSSLNERILGITVVQRLEGRDQGQVM